MSTQELVVLLDEQGNAVGTAPKATVHGGTTPLHRAFSCYVFGPDGRLLLTRRALAKRTFPGLWTNSVCGHPAPGECDRDAVDRRAGHELGLGVLRLQVALPAFRYRARSGGVEENEICPVYLGRTKDRPHPEPTEVQEHDWCTWPELLAALASDPDRFSPWCREQVEQLEALGAVPRYLTATTGGG